MVSDSPFGEEDALIRAWFQAALDRVEPEAAVRRHLRRDGRHLIVGERQLAVDGRLLIAAVGKAAVGMVRGAEAVCGDLIADGVAITKDGHTSGSALERVRLAEASHPIPDERGERATRQLLDLLRKTGSGDVVLALISGGGSALLEAPRPPVTLEDVATTTDLLMRAGAPITDLNAVRVPLSLVKGGGLRGAAGVAAFATLILSDVLGNDPRVIASGPTLRSNASRAAALAILERYGVQTQVPASVMEVLVAPDSNDEIPVGDGDPLVVVGDNATAVAAFGLAVEETGWRVSVIWQAMEGEAAELGREWVQQCREAPSNVDVLLGGGEATVTVRGSGVGGRNTEFALAAALALAEADMGDWIVASLATDGQDGPTGVAGAIADAGTVARAAAGGVDATAALRDNDSLRVFEVAGGVVVPGPTGTNVNDIYVAVRRH